MSHSRIVGQYMDVDGHHTYFDRVEGGDKGDIVCLHSAGASSLDWRYFLPHFGALGYRVVAPDLPGHGKSLLKNWQPLGSTAEFAAYVHALVSALGLDRPILVGCSLGGAVALELGAAYPDMWRAMVCSSCAGRHGVFPRAFIERSQEDSGIPGYNEFNYYRSTALCGPRASKECVEEIGWLRRRVDPKVASYDLMAFNDHNVIASLARVTCPVLFVRGEHDPVPRPAVEATAKLMPNAALQELAGVGHYPMLESPEYNALVAEFLGQQT